MLQTIHIEVKLPLLEDKTLPLELPEEKPEEEPGDKKAAGKKGKSKDLKTKDKKSGSNKSKSKSKSGSKKSKSSKKSAKAPSPYEADDEYEAEKRIRNTAYKTEGVPWSKVIQFPKDAVVVRHPEHDTTALRDTFRTRVNVKVVYLKVRYLETSVRFTQVI